MRAPYAHVILRRALATLLLLVLGLAAAQPRSLAVFPFMSQDARLGMAVADRLAHSLQGSVVPPEVALGLVPPYIVQENRFLSPLTLLGSGQGTNSPHAAAVLRDALGVDAAVTGGVRFQGGRLELELFVARSDGVRRFRLNAPESRPGRLARGARAVVSAFLGLGRRDTPLAIDLAGPYGDFVEGLLRLSGGLPQEARAAFARAAAAAGAEPRWRARLAALTVALEGELTDPALAAVVALNAQPLDAAAALRAFDRLAAPSLPAAGLWRALVRLQMGDRAGAEAAFEAAPRYPFGAVEGALYRAVNGRLSPPQAQALRRLETPGALLGALLVAQQRQDPALEKALATRLSRLVPSLPYAFERLSQRAFEGGDPLAAAQALAVATRLEPTSDLYWTNLGWAYYLLGLLGESEAASVRALALNPDAFVALYNLGLVRAVTGRLEEALGAYGEALARDPEVDKAALEDLKNALVHYPEVPELFYVLATLHEARGETEAAVEQFRRYAARAADEGTFVREARARIRALRAPLPPLEITPGARVGLGPDALEVSTYRPGDRLYPRFEVSTPGLELPTKLTLALALHTAAGAPVAGVRRVEQLEVPSAVVALQLDNLSLELPPELAPGRYRLMLTARARGRQARVSLPLGVTGKVSLLRQLVGRGLTLRDLASGRPLYSPQEVGHEGADEALVRALVGELKGSASAAAEVLPEVTRGRFAGQEGAAPFETSTPRDVRDFLGFLLRQGLEDTDLTFAEVYAQWALEGAPE